MEGSGHCWKALGEFHRKRGSIPFKNSALIATKSRTIDNFQKNEVPHAQFAGNKFFLNDLSKQRIENPIRYCLFKLRKNAEDVVLGKN